MSSRVNPRITRCLLGSSPLTTLFMVHSVHPLYGIPDFRETPALRAKTSDKYY